MKKGMRAAAAAAAAVILAAAVCACAGRGPAGQDEAPESTLESTREDAAADNSEKENETEAAADGLKEDFDPGYTDRDRDGSYDEAEAVLITLSPEEIRTDGEGAEVSGQTVTVTQAGVYVLRGTLPAGQIVVDIPDAQKSDKVQLVLDGVSVTCADGPALWVKSADKVFLTLAEGSENALSDGETYADESEDAPRAALYAVCDLTINGSGALSVEGKHEGGIWTKDDLVITGGVLTVTAVGHGLKGKDSVAVCGGEITVTAGNDAVKSDQDNSAEKGWISIDGGTLTLSASDMGLQAQNDIYITDGTLVIDSDNDCLHSNDSLRISGGTMTLTSRSKGIHADDYLTLDGGTIGIESCTEGLEGLVITIDGGDLSIHASDDGINATDGTGRDEGTMSRGLFGGLFGSDSSESVIQLNINGGRVYIQAAGDGVDSNGSLTVTGGELYVDGPTSGANGALDYATGGTITGGTVVAVGSVGMAVNFTEAEGQCAWMVSASAQQAAGSTITVSDESGTVLLSYTPQKAYRSIVVSFPELVRGGTYTICVDGTEIAAATLTDLITGSGSGFSGMGGGMNGGNGNFGGRGNSRSGRTQTEAETETQKSSEAPETGASSESLPEEGAGGAQIPGSAGRGGTGEPDLPQIPGNGI